jgi:hypothetical protein
MINKKPVCNQESIKKDYQSQFSAINTLAEEVNIVPEKRCKDRLLDES